MTVKNYGPVNSHPARLITQDANHRLVTDAQIDLWTNGVIGQAQFMSLVFKRSSTVPDTPVGGNFQFPIPDGGLWSNVPLPGIDPLFVSTRLFTNDGELPQQDVWSPPTIFVQNGFAGDTGPQGDKGDPGIQGSPGLNGINGSDGINGIDGVSINWLGDAESHPINPKNGDAYRNTTTEPPTAYTYWNGVWYVLNKDGSSGYRGSFTFTIDESDADSVYITPTTVAFWVGTLIDEEARNVARDIMSLSPDNHIRPNDKITLTDTNNQLSGTRVYFDGPKDLTKINEITAASFGGLVTEVIDANWIINGTVSADKLGADIISGGVINATLLNGTTITGGTIQTNNNVPVNGGVIMTADVIKVYDDSGNLRVKIGKLT